MDSNMLEDTANFRLGLLNADDLMALRNSSTNQLIQSVGQKKCDPSSNLTESDNILLLKNHKALLEQQRAARICDLIQAEWDENLQKSITKKMKGKFTRHMGNSSSGNITLSPEETVFLLENGLLELNRGGVPMSTEEAYATVLAGRLAIEKYQVYCHLFRLGYLVINHVEKREAMNSTETCKRSREETAQEDSQSVPKKAHLNQHIPYNDGLNGDVDDSQPLALVTGPVDRNASSESNMAPAVKHSVITLSSDFQKPIDATMPSKARIAMNENRNELPLTFSHSVSVSYDHVKNEEESDDDIEEDDNDNNAENETVGDNEVESDVVIRLDPSRLAYSTVGPSTIQIATKVSKCFIIAEQTEVTDDDDEEEEEEDDDDDEKVEVEVEKDEEIQAEKVEIVQEKENIEVEKVNEVEISAENNDEELSDDEEDDDDDDDEQYTTDESSDGFVNVENSVVKVDTDTASCDNNNDDEVLVVEIAKQKKQPLAVIDLLSDDEEEEAPTDDEDDDIQIIGECKGTSSIKQQFAKLKQEATASDVKKFDNSVTWQFPNLLKKSVICLPRPPPHLLPYNVRLIKELYTMDMKMITANNSNIPKPRLWNSYRDLHERKRQQQAAAESSSARFNQIQPFQPNFGSSPELNGHGTSPNFYGANWTAHNQGYGNTSQSGLYRNGQPMNYNQYIEHARQTAMHVAQSVMNQMTRNLPFPPPSLLPIPAHQPLHPCSNSLFPSVPDQTPYQVMDGRRGHQYEAPGGSDRNPPPLEDPMSCGGGPTYPSASNDTYQRRGNWFNTSERPFPSSIPKVLGRQKSWKEFKTAAGVDTRKESSSSSDDEEEDDIFEVPIDVDQILWSKTISPLVQPGMHNPEEISKCLSITQSADLLRNSANNRYVSKTSLEISFDVYLPGTIYKKRCPPVPNYRIVVVCANDPFPKESEIVTLQRKFSDNAALQFAVVSGSDVSFYSFGHIELPHLPLVSR